jgi:2-polyprenyl-6-methoxyphenol hydroxylase-like FAD-dependent oxidoreductase
MAKILVLGAGMNGLTTAMVLARDGHEVTVLERDPAAPPADPGAASEAWERWERRGVNQFRMLHLVLPRWRAEMDAELPEVLAELEAWGGLRHNFVAGLPPERSGGWRDGDERFGTLTARRPVLEAALSAVASRTPGVTIRRGVAITGLLRSEGSGPVPHVAGVLTEGGEAVRADLVVDACGRRSSLPSWLDAIDAARPREEREDCGFVYYARHFRSPDGQLPEVVATALVAHESVSVLALPADNGTWGVGIIASGRDRALRALRDPAAWGRALACYPQHAHWAAGEPISDGVTVMAGIEDRLRELVVDGRPVVTGVVAVGDSWACTNPSLGRGASIGMIHVCQLRDVLREVEPVEADKLVRRFDQATREVVEPLYRSTLAFDRHRLAEIEADIEGRPYQTDDPTWAIIKAMSAGATRDPDVLRAFAAVACLQATPEQVLAEPGVLERVIEVGADLPPYVNPGADRAGLLDAIAG